MQNKIIFALLILIIIISIVGSMIFLNKTSSSRRENTQPTAHNESNGIKITKTSSTTKKVSATTTTKKEIIPKAILYTAPKEPGRVVVIDIVKFAKSGYIVVYENTFEPTGEILGVSSFWGKGEYTNIPIVLNREVKDGESFTAMLHEDDGDRTFDIAKDGIYRDKKGNGVFTQILIQSTTP